MLEKERVKRMKEIQCDRVRDRQRIPTLTSLVTKSGDTVQ